MKNSMLSNLALLVGIVALLVALYEFYQFVTFRKPQGGGYDMQGGTNYLWTAIAAAVVAFICGLIFFVRRVNKEEEIHITQ